MRINVSAPKINSEILRRHLPYEKQIQESERVIMANVWRRTTDRPPPESATIRRVNRDGVASAVWIDAKGNRHKRDVTKAADGGWRLLTESYYIKFRNHRGVVITESSGLTSRELAERLLAERLDMVERIKSGRISAAEVRTLDRARLPMSQLVDEFLETFTEKTYRDATRRYMARFTEFNPNIRSGEIDSRVVQRWIDSLTTAGAGGQVLKKSRAALSLFTKWLFRTDVVSQPIPLQVSVPRLQPRKPRRAFGAEEFQTFLNAVESVERKLVYIFAASSGLRAKEISCVTIGDLRGLRSDQPSVMLDATWTKNRKPGVQPLPPAVGVMLADWIDSRQKSGDDKLFPGMPVRANMAEWFPSDLRRAGIPHIINNERLNFHSLRKSFVSWLLASGQDLRTVQLLARHSSPMLTASTYCDERLLDGRAAITSLPVLSVTPTVTPTTGDTVELVATPDDSDNSRSSLNQAEIAENEACCETASAYFMST
jgi:integrase